MSENPKMTTNGLSNYKETAALIRNFMLDYSWLFNFSNIDIVKDDFTTKVSSRFLVGWNVGPLFDFLHDLYEL